MSLNFMVENMLHQTMLLWHIDYIELEVTEN